MQPWSDFVFHFVIMRLLASQISFQFKNKWKSLGVRSGLGVGWCETFKQWCPFPSHLLCIFNFWITLVYGMSKNTEQNVCIKFCADPVKIWTDIYIIFKIVFWEEAFFRVAPLFWRWVYVCRKWGGFWAFLYWTEMSHNLVRADRKLNTRGVAKK